MDKHYVYVHVDKETQTPFYIGIGHGRRAYSKNRSYYWKRFVDGYVKEYDVNFAAENIDEETAREIENLLISYFGLIHTGNGLLVNWTPGGLAEGVYIKITLDENKFLNSQLTEYGNELLSKRKIDHLLIELGGNDGLRGFPPKLIKNNLLQIIDIAHKENIPVTMFNILIPPNYGPRYNKMFSAVFKEVSEIKEVSLLPFFMESIAIDKDLMQADGIHPNEKAQKYIVEIVEKQLDTLLGIKAQSRE